MIRDVAAGLLRDAYAALNVPPPAEVGAAVLGAQHMDPGGLASGTSAHQRHLLYSYIHVAGSLDRRLSGTVANAQRILQPDGHVLALADRLGSRIARKGQLAPTDVLGAPPPELVAELSRLVTRRARLAQPRVEQPMNGLQSAVYEHPDDRIALDALRAIPGFDRLVKLFIDHIARQEELRLLASNIEVTRESMPELYELFAHTCRTLGVEQPALYVMPGALNAFTTGTGKPIVVVTQSLISVLSEKELMFVLGHELGHIKSGHVLYMTMARLASALAALLADMTFGLGGVIANATLLPLLKYWQRRAELTCDRAGLLACQDPDAAISVLAKLGGLPLSAYDDFDPRDFAAQAQRLDLALADSMVSRLLLMLDVMDETHPRSVWRAAILNNWVAAGEYDDLVGATESQRRHLADMLGDDPLVLPFVDDVVETIVEWTGQRDAAVVPVRRQVRRMIRLGEKPTHPIVSNIFSIEVELGWRASSTMALTVRLLVLKDDKPARVELVSERAQSWSRLPKECREALLRSGKKSLTYSLYRSAR